MAATLTTISPISGPPGSAITCVGTGFAPGSQVGCPTLVPTTYVSATQVTAAIPAVAGAAGTNLQIAVAVWNADGSVSNSLMFTVVFPPAKLQAWTDVDAVCGEIPGFARGGRIQDSQVQTWIRSVAQEIAAEMLRRGLSLDPSTWQQPGTAGSPDPVDVLEMVNRMGAAARLAAAVGTQFAAGGQEWGVSKSLQAAYARQLGMLRAGDYDKLFSPSAATVESGPLLAFGDTTKCDGTPSAAFRKEKVF